MGEIFGLRVITAARLGAIMQEGRCPPQMEHAARGLPVGGRLAGAVPAGAVAALAIGVVPPIFIFRSL